MISRFSRPAKIAAIIYDDGTRRDIDEFRRGNARYADEVTRLIYLHSYIEELIQKWAAYELGVIDPSVVIFVNEHLRQLEQEEKKRELLKRFGHSIGDRAKEGEITTRLVLAAARRLVAKGTPERNLASMISKFPGVDRSTRQVRNILNAAKKGNTK